MLVYVGPFKAISLHVQVEQSKILLASETVEMQHGVSGPLQKFPGPVRSTKLEPLAPDWSIESCGLSDFSWKYWTILCCKRVTAILEM